MGRIEDTLARAHQLLLRARNELDNNWPTDRVCRQTVSMLREAHQVMGELRTIIRHNPPRGAMAFFHRLERAERRLTREIPSNFSVRHYDAAVRYDSVLRNLTDLAVRYERGGLQVGDRPEREGLAVLRLARPLLRERGLLTQDQRDTLTLVRANLGVARYHYHLRRAEHFLRAAAAQNNHPTLLARAATEFQRARFLHQGLLRLRQGYDFEVALAPRFHIGSRVTALLGLQTRLRTAAQSLSPESVGALMALRQLRGEPRAVRG